MLRLISFSVIWLATLSSAHADPLYPYRACLHQLEKRIAQTVDDGLSASELKELQSGRCPEIADNAAFQDYYAFLGRSLQKIGEAGIDRRDLELVSLLVEIGPKVTSSACHNPTIYLHYHRLFVDTVAWMARNTIQPRDLKLIEQLAAIAPQADLGADNDDRLYSSWNDAHQQLARRLYDKGLSPADKKLLALHDRTKPSSQPMMIDPPSFRIDSADRERSYITTFSACDQTYTTRWIQRRQNTIEPTTIVLMVEGNQLIEVDPKRCRLRWLADHALDLMTLRHGDLLVTRESGAALIIDQKGLVYPLPQNGTDCRIDSPQEGDLRILFNDSNRQEHWIAFDLPRNDQRYPFRIDDHAVFSDPIYQTIWHPR